MKNELAINLTNAGYRPGHQNQRTRLLSDQAHPIT